MPIKDDKALTKVRGVSNREAQMALKHLQNSKGDFKVEITADHVVTINSENLSQPVNVGEVREKYLDFIESLHNPVIEPKITGGTWRVYDENHNLVKEVLDLNDLPIYEQGLIFESYWTIQRNNNGLNPIIHEGEED